MVQLLKWLVKLNISIIIFLLNRILCFRVRAYTWKSIAFKSPSSTIYQLQCSSWSFIVRKFALDVTTKTKGKNVKIFLRFTFQDYLKLTAWLNKLKTFAFVLCAILRSVDQAWRYFIFIESDSCCYPGYDLFDNVFKKSPNYKFTYQEFYFSEIFVGTNRQVVV